MSKSKLVKKLTMILFTLVAIFATGLTNVNAETAEVKNYSELTEKMGDNVTNIVKLTSDITLNKDYDTKIFIEMSKTLDFNGFTLTIPEKQRLQLIYKNSLDLKFINSNSSRRAKLNILTHSEDPIYNEIQKTEYIVNFEIDGVDVEYEKDFETFWSYVSGKSFNNLVFKNLKITGFYEVASGGKTIKFSNVTKENKKSPKHTVLMNRSDITVDEVIDADSIIEYSDREGTKIANRADKLSTIDAYYGPITVKKKEVQTLSANDEATLIDAVNQINNSKDTIIKLGGDIKLNAPLYFYVLGNVTLDLVGNTLDVTENHLTFYYGYKDPNNYNFRSNLTIKDSGSGNSGKIVGVGFNGRIRLSTLDMAEELKNLPKTYGFTIDGGTYAVTGTGMWDEYIFDVFTDPEPLKQNITLNVNVKKGIFEVEDVDGGIFHFPSSAETNMEANFNFETLMVKGRGVILGFNILGKKRIEEVMPSDTKIYYTDSNQEIELEDRTTLVTNVRTSTSDSYPQYIKLAKETGLSVDNVTLPNVTFGYTDVPEATINIANIGADNLQITNVTVSDNFAINISSQPTIGIGETNTDFKVKAKSSLNAGNYTGTITVTDENGKTYTATVTLKVEKKNLTVGISGLVDTWVYGETKTPTATGVDGLGVGEYEITYSKENNDSYEDIGTTLPKLVGKYKATLSITNSNYTASDATVYFEIKPTMKELKIVASSSEHEYDGTLYTDNRYTITFDGNEVTNGKLLYNDIIGNVQVVGSVTAVEDNSENNNVIDRNSLTITNKESYGNIVYVDGTLKVTPSNTPITITPKDASKKYDGNKLIAIDYEMTGTLFGGDRLEVTYGGDVTYVGSGKSTISSYKIMSGETDVTKSYKVTLNEGNLEITVGDRDVTASDMNVLIDTTLDYNKIKDNLKGTFNTNPEFSIVSGNGTYDETNGFTAPSTSGTTVMEAKLFAEDLNNDGVNDLKEDTVRFNIITSSKETVTISGLTDNQEFIYDGTSKKPSGTINVDGDKVPVDGLEVKYAGTGGYDSTEAPTNAGSYTVTYRVKDENPTYVGSVTYTFTIKKAQLEKVTIVKDTFEYTGSDITPTLNNVNSNIEVTGDTTAKNVSNNTITAKITDKTNYEWKGGSNGDLTINWSITQATPDYTVPTGLTGLKGKTLNDVTLPDRFTWKDASTVLTAGTNKYKATYTPVDTTNYKTINDIDIEVVVKNTFDVMTSVDGGISGGNGTITPSKIDVIEGSKVIIEFTPNTGYMIDKVLVNGVNTPVVGNKLELTVNEEKKVVVSYKKIPFTVTVKDVDGATILPNGAVAVSYGEDKEFTITANSGYKLVKVLVDGTDKTADMVGDTLKLTNITSNINLEVVVEKIVYEVTEGANQKYTITKNNEAKFKINADFRLFDDGKVYVDNELVDPKNYTAESGSTIITLKKEFVDTLSVGEHTLKVLFNDGGEAITTFNVARVTVPTDNPNTGDNIGFYIISGILSIVGLAGAGIFYRRKQTN